MPLRVGDAQIGRVEEQLLPIPFALLTDDEEFIARRIAPLPSGFLDPATMTFQFSNHSWLVRVDGLTVLVDPCNGNHRKRAVPNFDDLELPYLDRLNEAGTSVDSIDLVFCTHLHNDHCGWNTREVDGRWVPTFPNAEYLFVDAEYRRWDTSGGVQHPNDFNESVFDECVRPVVDAGQAKILSAPHAISESLSIEVAPGHTIGHSMLRLESNGARAYFTGDVFHHPAQITRCDLHLPGCDDLTLAIETRRALVGRMHDEVAFLFPAHFSAPHYGSLDVDGGEVVFRPGGLTGSLEAID